MFEMFEYWGFTEWAFIDWIICYLITFINLIFKVNREDIISYTVLSFQCTFLWPFMWLNYFVENKKR